MDWSIAMLTAPTDEPITLVEAKKHLRVTSDLEDDVISSLIESAREYVEQFTRRQLMTATIKASACSFPWGSISLPHSPVQSVTSISYIDGAGVVQTYAGANYNFDSGQTPPRINLGYGLAWPQTRGIANAVSITYVAGYASASLIPPSIRNAIKMVVGDLYKNREAQSSVRLEENETVCRMLWPHRVFLF